MNPNNTLSGQNVTKLANSTNINSRAPVVSMTANGSLQLSVNAFGTGKSGILTRWGSNSTGMFSSTEALTFGQGVGGYCFTIYFLGRNATMDNSTEVGYFSFGLPTPLARGVNYQAEFTRVPVDGYGSSIIPGALSRGIGGTGLYWIGQMGTRNAETYPKYQDTFEVWCITKSNGDTIEVYLNNTLVSLSSTTTFSANWNTWGQQGTGYWQLGDGATTLDRGNGVGSGTYIGAFQFYNKYHNYSARCGILRSLMSTFYIPPTARVGGIKSSTVPSNISRNVRTGTFTITIDDYPHRNVQSLKDFYVFFATPGSIPSSINIIENNVTAIDTSVPGDVTLTCTAVSESLIGGLELCLAIATPGSSNTTPTTTILSGNGCLCSQVGISRTFQIELWFSPNYSWLASGWDTLLVQTGDVGGSSWDEVYRYETNTGYWQDQANDLVNNYTFSTAQIPTNRFCNYYNECKFTTPPITIKDAVTIHFADKSNNAYWTPCNLDAIRIKVNGKVYTTYDDAFGDGIRFSWITTTDDTKSTNVTGYLTNKYDSATDMTSPITINGTTYQIRSGLYNNSNMYELFNKGSNSFRFGSVPGDAPGNFQETNIANTSCLRICFPFRNVIV